MFHGFTNQLLYSAYKIEVYFYDNVGNRKAGVGTCFFVQNKSGKLCLITNRHVLDFAFRNPMPDAEKYRPKRIVVSGKASSIPGNVPVSDISFELAPLVKFLDDSSNDVACITDFVVMASPGVRIDYFIPYHMIATQNEFENDLSVCDFLAFPGFPEWHDKKANRPILRTGTISSDPRYDYSFQDAVDGACVAYEAFSFSGSSGSPIFALQKGPAPGIGISFPGFRSLRFIGINAGHLKVTERLTALGDELQRRAHSGISYFYKSTVISDLIDG